MSKSKPTILAIQSPSHCSTFTLDDLQIHITQFFVDHNEKDYPEFVAILALTEETISDDFHVEIDYYDSRKYYAPHGLIVHRMSDAGLISTYLREPFKQFEIATAIIMHCMSSCLAQKSITINVL